MRRIVPLVVFGLACARAAGAQAHLPLSEGTRVRVQTQTSNPQVGTVSGFTDDTLYFRSERTGQVQALHVARLRRVEVSEGKGNRLRSTAIGAAGGLGAGAVMSTAFGRGCDTALSPTRGTCNGGRQTLSLALEIGALGALIGAVVPLHERWRRVLAPHAASLHLSPARREIGLALRR